MYLLLTSELKLRKVTDYNQVPLGTNHFGAKHRIGFSNANDLPAVPSPAVPPPDGPPFYPLHPQHHYSYPHGPYHPLPVAPYGSLGHYAPGFAPLNPVAFPPASAPGHSLYSNQVQLDDSTVRNQAVVPEQSNPGLSVPQVAVKAFCDKYDLGDEEREGLRKLGFRVGDALDTVTESEWVISGLAPLHRRRVLLAWNTEHGVQL